MTMNRDEYSVIAGGYNAVSRAPLRALRWRIAAACAEQGWRSVLDYGCGTGEQLNILRTHGIKGIGFDISPAMLKVARANYPELTFVLGPSMQSFGQSLGQMQRQSPKQYPNSLVAAPFEDGSFDAVLLSLVLHETTSGAGNILCDALRLAPRALVLEWRMPERNMDYPGLLLTYTIERLAGRGHYRRFRQFAESGWLRGLARREGCTIAWERRELYGLFSLALLEKYSV
jgi:SAM-dependent methyltransferase